MDKRRKRVDPQVEIARREQLIADLEAGVLDIPTAIRRMREAVYFTREEYAKITKVTPRALASIETGKGNPTLKTLRKLGKPYGLVLGFRKLRKD